MVSLSIKTAVSMAIFMMWPILESGLMENVLVEPVKENVKNDASGSDKAVGLVRTSLVMSRKE